MVKENIKIVIGMFNAPAMKGMKQLRGGLNLLSSAFRAVFRTTIVAGMFLALRQVFLAIQNIKNAVIGVTAELVKMNSAATLTGAVMSKGGSSFQKNFEGAARIARESSAAIGKAATDIQNGLFIAGIAGFNLADAMKLTEQAMQLSAVSAMDFKAIMNDLIALSRGFRVNMKDMPSITNTLAAAFTKVKMELADVFQGLKRVAAIAVTAFGPGKDTIFDMSAAIMTLNDVGVEASRAATYMRSGITRLLSPTNKVTTAFAKYGINIFKSTAQNQRFLGTLLKGQSAMSGYYEKLNKLKKRQFDLVISGKTSGEAFEGVNKQLQEVNKTMSLLDKGVSDVYKQFTMAGGQLKPFNKLLDELIKKKIPPEVVAGIFGVRTGQMITTLLANPEKFKANKKYLVEINKEYEKGNSILTDMYHRILETVGVKWARLGTTIKAVFSTLFDAIAPTLSNLLDPILNGLTSLYDSVEKNKGLFKQLFEGVGEVLGGVLKNFEVGLTQIAAQIRDVVTVGRELTLPVYTFIPPTTDSSGGIRKVDVTLGKESGFKERFSLLAESFSSIFLAHFAASMEQLKEPMEMLATWFVKAIAVQLELQIALFKKIGGWIARGVVEGMGNLFNRGRKEDLIKQAYADPKRMGRSLESGMDFGLGESFKEVLQEIVSGKLVQKMSVTALPQISKTGGINRIAEYMDSSPDTTIRRPNPVWMPTGPVGGNFGGITSEPATRNPAMRWQPTGPEKSGGDITGVLKSMITPVQKTNTEISRLGNTLSSMYGYQMNTYQYINKRAETAMRNSYLKTTKTV